MVKCDVSYYPGMNLGKKEVGIKVLESPCVDWNLAAATFFYQDELTPCNFVNKAVFFQSTCCRHP